MPLSQCVHSCLLPLVSLSLLVSRLFSLVSSLVSLSLCLFSLASCLSPLVSCFSSIASSGTASGPCQTVLTDPIRRVHRPQARGPAPLAAASGGRRPGRRRRRGGGDALPSSCASHPPRLLGTPPFHSDLLSLKDSAEDSALLVRHVDGQGCRGWSHSPRAASGATR